MPREKKFGLSDGLYIVERIIRHRVGKSGLEYFVKWQHYPSKQNSWIPAAYFYSPNLVDAYHKRINAIQNTPKTKMASPQQNSEAKAVEIVMEYSAGESPIFVSLLPHERYEPGGILTRMIDLNIRRDNNERVALIEWRKETSNHSSYLREYVPIDWMHINYPQMVIKFYEDRVFFRNKRNGSLEKCRS